MTSTDDASGSDLVTAHGGDVAQLELCAPTRPLRARVQVTVEAGKAEALVAVVDLQDTKP